MVEYVLLDISVQSVPLFLKSVLLVLIRMLMVTKLRQSATLVLTVITVRPQVVSMPLCSLLRALQELGAVQASQLVIWQQFALLVMSVQLDQ